MGVPVQRRDDRSPRGIVAPLDGHGGGDEPVRLRIVQIVPDESFTDQMDADDFIVRTMHRLEPLPDGRTRVTYRTEITGPAADQVGPQLGPAITGDFPEVLAALIKLVEA